MIIKKLKISNIRSYEDAEIEFPEGSTLLAGDIGSGKTSILLATEFALFGLQPGQKGASLLRSGEKTGQVSLELEIDGNKIVIERSLKRGKSVSQEDASITINDEKKEMSVTELKNKVLSLLNYPQEFAKKTNLLYRFTVYTPQEEMKQIILENPEERLDTLRHVFGIDKYRRIKQNIDIFTLKLREEIRNKQGQVQDLEEKKSKKELKTSSIDSLNLKLLELEKKLLEDSEKRKLHEMEIKEVQDKIEEKRKLESEVEKTRAIITGKKELFSSLVKDEERLKQQIEEINKIPSNELDTMLLEKQKIDTQEIIDDANKQYFELLSQINSLNIKKSEAETLKSSISRLHLCPTCLQNVDDSYKANIINKLDTDISESKKNVLKLSEDKEAANKKIVQERKNLQELEKRISELKLLKVKLESVREKQLELENIQKKKTTIEKDLIMLEKHVESLKEMVFEFSKYDTIFQKKKQELDQALKQEKQSEIQLAGTRKEIEMTRREIAEIEQEIVKKEETKKRLVYISELEDWLSSKFSNLISFTERNVMLKLKEEFSKLFNEWFNILVPDIFSVRLDDDFTPLIEQQDYELDYSFLSGGERTAIALAYRLALNQTINSLLSKIKTKDIVILDEPTDGFSEQQLDKMRDVLAQLKVKQLILVSHEAKIESFVSSVIKFKKEAGLTRIEK